MRRVADESLKLQQDVVLLRDQLNSKIEETKEYLLGQTRDAYSRIRYNVERIDQLQKNIDKNYEIIKDV